MDKTDKAAPTGNTPVDVELKVKVKADFLYNGRPLTATHVERMVRHAVKREFDTLDCEITVSKVQP